MDISRYLTNIGAGNIFIAISENIISFGDHNYLKNYIFTILREDIDDLYKF